MTQRPIDDGAIAILVALMSVVLFGFGALVVDIGDAQTVRSQSQNAVDAAALAGVRVLAAAGTPTPAGTDAAVATTVKTYVSANIGAADWADCTDPAPLAVPADGSDTCISMSAPISPGVPSYQVRVKLPARHVPSTFGGIFGVSSISISPIAQALSGQPLPPDCGPCNPVLDETGQPKLPNPPSQCELTAPVPSDCFPFRSELPNPLLVPPDPDAIPPAGPVDAPAGGCPTTPGLFTSTAFPAGVTIAAGFRCDLKPGLYVFDDTTLDVQGTLFSHLALNDPTGIPDGTGVTLIFYGTSQKPLTVEGNLGPLLASRSGLTWQQGQPIPGVAIVIDQFDQAIVADRTFTLGDGFDITGSLYALDRRTTWATNSGDCMPTTSTCVVHDEDGAQSLIATTATAFSDQDANGIGRIPTVATDHPMAEPPPSPPHLVPAK